MLDHWEAYGPPVYMSVASYLGLNKGKTSPVPVESVSSGSATDEEMSKYGNLNELAALFSGSGGVIQ